MPQQPAISVENNFSLGLRTEITGLSFPEHAVTDAENCVFERLGNVHRRLGIDYEANYTLTTIDRSSVAVSSYKWNNVGGDGSTQLIVVQVGATLHFYRSSSATVNDPLSDQKLASTVTISSFVSTGGSFTASKECQYADGNGFLIVFHPDCDPFYVTYNAGTLTGTVILVKIRDFRGVVDNYADNFRPPTLSTQHQYNLQNQGWTNSPGWTATSGITGLALTIGSHSWTVQAGLNTPTVRVIVGQSVSINTVPSGSISGQGLVTAYNNGTGLLTINVTSSTDTTTVISRPWSFASLNTSNITTWNTAVGNYPSNADVWWRFKNSSDVFAPATTVNNVTLNQGPAPRGYYVLNAFNQTRTTASSIAGITDITTTTRPRTGCWFAGRVWYAGVDAAQLATGDADTQVWTESLYFSQTVEKPEQFGQCHQTNDPTSEDLFDLYPDDGGVITIQGTGPIYKLFPLQNGLLVFAANGIWFITGSQGIGFAANDYVIVKISSIQSISSTSFVDVQGYPVWWNEEGIYMLTPGSQGQENRFGNDRGAVGNSGFSVTPVSFTTIQSFYDDIPLDSKKYARGVYDPLSWEIKWIYRTTQETTTTERYQFDGILTLNTATQSIYPHTLSTDSGVPYINSIRFVQSPGGSTGPLPAIKYFCSKAVGASYSTTFAEERDVDYVDWQSSGTQYGYTSYFVSGFRIKGQGINRVQPNYVVLYLKNEDPCSYKIQGIWDYAISGDSGKYTSFEQRLPNVDKDAELFAYVFNRHRIRGRGLVYQFKVTSVPSQPFDIIGWIVEDKVNAGP